MTRAYKCSSCRRWIPREGHAPDCPRVAAHHEATVRLEAARTWIDHALAGDVELDIAAAAVCLLLEVAQAFEEAA